MDLLTDLTIPLLAGGIGGGVVGLVGAAWQSRRDHRRWLRERRYEAFNAYLTAIDQKFLMGDDSGDFSRILETQSNLTLVGPGSIIPHAIELYDAGHQLWKDDNGGTEEHHDALAMARSRFVRVAQAALQVPGNERWRDERIEPGPHKRFGKRPR